METIRIDKSALEKYVSETFKTINVPAHLSELAARSMIDASLLGVDTHGIDALPMYVKHFQAGGMKAEAEPQRLQTTGVVELWDGRHGFGLAAGRIIMTEAIHQARQTGVYFATCRNANHLGACGVYAKMAADAGLIGVVSQQALASLAPWGGLDARIGSSPFALSAPVQDAFPFYFDASMAAMTRAQIKNHRYNGQPLPEGIALNAQGCPTQDPEEAWLGQIMPIGGHKGVGLAMAFEILACVLSANQFSTEVPSIVDHPEQSADSSFFMMALDPAALGPLADFKQRMKNYIDNLESSTPRDPENPPRYPGRREGETWAERSKNGIPVASKTLDWLAASTNLSDPHVLRPAAWRKNVERNGLNVS